MTRMDTVSLVIIALLLICLVRSMINPEVVDDPMKSIKRLRLGIDDFIIEAQNYNSCVYRMAGAAFDECQPGDIVHIEQLVGETLTIRITHTAVVNGTRKIQGERA